MKAYITSVSEPTTDLCEWALERQGFDICTIQDSTSLWAKLKFIYNDANEDFLRIDADTIVNQNCTATNIYETCKIAYLKNAWWVQFMTFSWFSQDITHGGVQFIKKEALPYLRESVDKFEHIDRPETQLSRIYQFYNPRRFETNDMVMGLNGYGQADINKIKMVKAARNQLDNYDFELAERLNSL